MKKFRHLTYEDRIYIEVWRWERKSQGFIAKALGVHPSTISRECYRGNPSGDKLFWWPYRADIGERGRRISGSKKGAKRKIVGEVAQLVEKLIHEDWSPEQISARFELEGQVSISHESIYGYVKRDRAMGGKLYLHLRRGKRRRKKRFSVPRIRQDILNRKHISTRPKVINDRKREGDWERDLVFAGSRREALLTFVDRKTLKTVLCRVSSKSPKEIAKKTIFAMRDERCLSLTNDNGFEFREHEYESRVLKIPIYFTNPYSSWEKGTNENMNGLIRQYLPKKGNIKDLTDAQIKRIEEKLNNRPRKKLGFQTPLEASSGGNISKLCQL